jgi:glycosyltransferase involved in cell wall biosynthesis
MTPRLSVVIPTRDRPAMLERCLASVVASISADDEVLVVDSASRDHAAVAAVASAAGVACLRCEVPGASVARNAGWHAAAAPVVAFVDDDVWVSPGWAAALVECAHTYRDAAWVAGRIEVPDDQIPGRAIAVLNQTEPATLDAATPTGRLGHSANLLVRIDALRATGGFDVVLGAGGPLRAAEDLDLVDRLIEAGHTGRFEPAALAWHDQWRTRSQLIRLDWSYGIGNGARISKLLRRPGQRRRAWRETKDAFWAWGVRPGLAALRDRYESKAAMDFARVGGNIVGFARGITFGAEHGHLRPRRRSAQANAATSGPPSVTPA